MRGGTGKKKEDGIKVKRGVAQEQKVNTQEKGWWFLTDCRKGKWRLRVVWWRPESVRMEGK